MLKRSFWGLAFLGLATAPLGCGEVLKSSSDGPPIDTPIDTPIDAPIDALRIPGQPAITSNVTAMGDTIGLCVTGSFGWHFRPRIDMRVVALSYFDFAPAGLFDAHEVGIFDSAGALLRRARITNASQLVANFRLEPIEPVTLTVNATYVMGSTNPGSDHSAEPGTGCGDRFGHDDSTPGAVVADPQVNYVGVVSTPTTDPAQLVFPGGSPGMTVAFRIGASFEYAQ